MRFGDKEHVDFLAHYSHRLDERVSKHAPKTTNRPRPTGREGRKQQPAGQVKVIRGGRGGSR